MSSGVPPGFHTVTPRLFVENPAAYVDFLRQAFGAEADVNEGSPAQVRIGDSLLLVSGADVRQPFPAYFYLYVPDADATYERALAAGAESVETPRDVPYGDRRAMVRDPAGHTWQIATYRGS